MDAIQLIRQDHRNIDRLFKSFESAEHDSDPRHQEQLMRQLIRELSLHAAIEEEFLYPALRKAGASGPVLEALEEHHLVKVTLLELDRMDVGDERLGAKVRILEENVRRHVQEEERALLPILRRALQPAQLRELGGTLAIARNAAPTRPHPATPNTPPGNLILDPVAALYDRGRDALRKGTDVVKGATRIEAKGMGMARELAARAGQRGRQAVEQARRRGRETAAEARDRGRRAVARALEGGREAGRQVQRASQEAAREVRDTRRSATRGSQGKPRDR